MKKKVYFIFALSLIATSVLFVGCSSDDDLVPSNEDLGIDSQVSLTRSGADPQMGINKDSNKLYNVAKNSCCIIVWVNDTRLSNHGNWPQNTTAQDKYDDEMRKAKSYGYDEGTQMSGEVWKKMCEDHHYTGYANGMDLIVENFNQGYKVRGRIVTYDRTVTENGVSTTEQHTAMVHDYEKNKCFEASKRPVYVMDPQGRSEIIMMDQIKYMNYYEDPKKKK